jgi:hypothetical protein
MRKFVFIFYFTMLRRGRESGGAHRPEAMHGIHFVNFAQDRLLGWKKSSLIWNWKKINVQ